MIMHVLAGFASGMPMQSLFSLACLVGMASGFYLPGVAPRDVRSHRRCCFIAACLPHASSSRTRLLLHRMLLRWRCLDSRFVS